MKIAFIIPLHIKHMKHVPNLGELVTPLSDVYIILTTQKDFNIFNRSPVPIGIKILVLSNLVPEAAIYLALKNKSIPTFKKWMGMHIVLNTDQKYSYMICCDSEIKMVKPIDQSFIDSLPSQFNFVGDHITDKYRESKKILEVQDAWLLTQKLKNKPCFSQIYCWWSGLPLYNTASLKAFLNFVGTDDPIKLAGSLAWEIFDHLFYQLYTVSLGLHDAKYICLTHDLKEPNGWSLERGDSVKCREASRKAGLMTLWARAEHYRTRQESVSDAYIIYHVDG